MPANFEHENIYQNNYNVEVNVFVRYDIQLSTLNHLR